MFTGGPLYPMVTVSLLCVFLVDTALTTSESSVKTLKEIQNLINEIGTFIDKDGNHNTGQKEQEAWDVIGTLQENQEQNTDDNEKSVEEELGDGGRPPKRKQGIKPWNYKGTQKNKQRTTMWKKEATLNKKEPTKEWNSPDHLEKNEGRNQWKKRKHLEYDELLRQWEKTKKMEENGLLGRRNKLQKFQENKLSKQKNKLEKLERNQLPKQWDKSEKLQENHVPKQANKIEALEDIPVPKVWNKEANLKEKYFVPNQWNDEKTLMKDIHNNGLPHPINHKLVDSKKVQDLLDEDQWNNMKELKMPQMESRDEKKIIKIEKMLSILCQKQKTIWIGCYEKDPKALNKGILPIDKNYQHSQNPGSQHWEREDAFPIIQGNKLWKNQMKVDLNPNLKELLPENWDSSNQNMETQFDNKHKNIKQWGIGEALHKNQDTELELQESKHKLLRPNMKGYIENLHSNMWSKERLTLQGKDEKMENNERETKMWTKEKNSLNRNDENMILKPWETADVKFKEAKIGNGNWFTQDSVTTEAYKDELVPEVEEKFQSDILALLSNIRNKPSKNNNIWKSQEDINNKSDNYDQNNNESSSDEITNDELPNKKDNINDETAPSPDGKPVFNGFMKTPDGGKTGETYFNGIFNDNQHQQQQKEDEFKDVSEDRLDGAIEASNGIINEAHSLNGPAILNVPGVSGTSVEAKNNIHISSKSRKYSPENSDSGKDIPEYDISANYGQHQNLPKSNQEDSVSSAFFSGKMALETEISGKNDQKYQKYHSGNLTSTKILSEDIPRDPALMDKILKNKNSLKNDAETKISLKNSPRSTTPLQNKIRDNTEGHQDLSNTDSEDKTPPFGEDETPPFSEDKTPPFSEDETPPFGEDETPPSIDTNLDSLLLSGISISKAQHKRRIQDRPIGDGPFLVVVMGLTGMCILAVLGVGYCLHRPAGLSRLPAPGSADISPTFHSAKLTFSAAETSPDSDNAMDKADRNTNNNNRFTGSRAKIYERPTNFKTNPNMRVGRMESLITLTDDEEEGDLIYECPGLAPTGEMVVSNPFFLSGEIGHITGNNLPCPINTSGNIRHGNIIKGIN